MNDSIKKILYSKTSDIDKEINDFEYKQFDLKFDEIEEELLKTFNAEQAKLYDKYIDAFYMLKSKEIEVYFIRGFKRGMRTVIEAFAEE